MHEWCCRTLAWRRAIEGRTPGTDLDVSLALFRIEKRRSRPEEPRSVASRAARETAGVRVFASGTRSESVLRRERRQPLCLDGPQCSRRPRRAGPSTLCHRVQVDDHDRRLSWLVLLLLPPLLARAQSSNEGHSQLRTVSRTSFMRRSWSIRSSTSLNFFSASVRHLLPGGVVPEKP